MSLAYDFPVELQPVFLPNGIEIQKSKAIVRTDTGQPLATVSNKYHLIPYADVIGRAEQFMESLGAPEKKFWLTRDGAQMVGEYVYRDRAADVAVGDLVGLKIYIENSYNKNKAVIFRVGGMRLKCLNGMVSDVGTFEQKFRHLEGAMDRFSIPKPDEILNQFQSKIQSWKRLGEIKLDHQSWNALCDQAVEKGIIPDRAREVSPTTDIDMEDTAWKLYNKFTYYVNHSERESASRIGKIRRLERIDRFFSKHIQ